MNRFRIPQRMRPEEQEWTKNNTAKHHLIYIYNYIKLNLILIDFRRWLLTFAHQFNHPGMEESMITIPSSRPARIETCRVSGGKRNTHVICKNRVLYYLNTCDCMQHDICLMPHPSITKGSSRRPGPTALGLLNETE